MEQINQHLFKNKFYVYTLTHSDGTLLYVGKGSGKRVYHLYGKSSNYFINQYYFYCQFNRLPFPEPNIIPCSTECKALSLEHQLIYQNKPLFNTMLKDKEPFDIDELFQVDNCFKEGYNSREINYWEEE